MMADVTTPGKSRALAFQAGLALVVSVIFASIHFNVFGINVSFLFAPFIVLFLWPKGADLSMSYVAVFLSSLLLDIFLGAPLGGWALIYLPVFILVTEFSRRGETGFAEDFVSFCVALGALLAFFLLAKFTKFINVDVVTLLKSAIACLILFPLIYKLKDRLRSVLGAEDA